MSNPIKEKATAWWQLISGEETAESYKKFFQLTWTILKETALLLWLLLCFVLVAIGWAWNNSSRVTEKVSEIRTQANQKPDANVMADAAVKLWEASKNGAANAVSTARKQLNLPETEKKKPIATPEPVATPVKEPPTPEPTTTQTPEPQPQETSEPPAASEPATEAAQEPASTSSDSHSEEDANPEAAVEQAKRDASGGFG